MAWKGQELAWEELVAAELGRGESVRAGLSADQVTTQHQHKVGIPGQKRNSELVLTFLGERELGYWVTGRRKSPALAD